VTRLGLLLALFCAQLIALAVHRLLVGDGVLVQRAVRVVDESAAAAAIDERFALRPNDAPALVQLEYRYHVPAGHTFARETTTLRLQLPDGTTRDCAAPLEVPRARRADDLASRFAVPTPLAVGASIDIAALATIADGEHRLTGELPAADLLEELRLSVRHTGAPDHGAACVIVPIAVALGVLVGAFGLRWLLNRKARVDRS
jgi:hypothetical protein